MDTALGTSPFNYQDYTVWRFIHYFQQLRIVLGLHPKSVLEIGPGDHMVSDFLSRKGIEVVTADSDPALKPNVLLDLLDPNFSRVFNREFDVCLASEVLEHLSFRHFRRVSISLGKLACYLVISVPYSTIRLFPDRPDYGRFISCEGRIMIHIPLYVYRMAVAIPRFAKGILCGRGYDESKGIFPISLSDYADSFTGHHWDCGDWATRPSVVRKCLEEDFVIHHQVKYVSTNCIFWVVSLRKD